MLRLLAVTGVCALGLMTLSVPAQADYVGSDKCFECHADQYNDWQASGHPWKLRKMEKARYAKLPPTGGGRCGCRSIIPFFRP